jgi:tetratricopeptide (TPR) repeat protein
MAYQAEGAEDLAMMEYEQALQVNPRLAPAYINIAGIYFSRDDLENSEKALKIAMDMSPTLPAPYLNLARIALKGNQPQKALEILSRAQTIRAVSRSHLFHIVLGDAYAQLGRHADAVKEYKEAIRLRPDLGNAEDMPKARLDELKRTGAIQ